MFYPYIKNKPYRKWLRVRKRRYNEWQLNRKWLMFWELRKKRFSWKWLIVGYDLLVGYFYRKEVK